MAPYKWQRLSCSAKGPTKAKSIAFPTGRTGLYYPIGNVFFVFSAFLSPLPSLPLFLPLSEKFRRVWGVEPFQRLDWDGVTAFRQSFMVF